MKLIFTSALLFIIYICQGQVDKRITIGTIDSVYSELLKENRQLLIYLPETYNNNQKYPVVYLLDGESFFHFYTSIVSHLSSSYVVPEIIVIGIANTNRTRDFTPTIDSTSNGKPNGGGEIFTAF